MGLHTRLSEHSQNIETCLADFFSRQRHEAKGIDPLIVQSIDLLSTFSLRGGKTVRSFLTELAYKLAHGPKNAGLLSACASVELHHKHLLILDDIADRDDVRYGGPTLEYAYQDLLSGLPDMEHKARSFAMLDGVLLGSLSKELLFESHFDPKLLVECIGIFDTIMLRDTLAGWKIHGMQAMHHIAETTPEEFIKGLELVTARYTFLGPIHVGLTLAKNTDTTLTSALDVYAHTVGTAFQIYDDILGLFGNPEATGKPVGNDVREGKKTLLLQYAYKVCSAEEKKFLDTCIGNAFPPTQLHRIQEIVRNCGALLDSQTQANDLVAKGIRALDVLPPSSEKELLIELAHYIINREK